MRPALSADNELAFNVWRFCAGWNPERIPLAAAYYGVEDVDLLVEQLMALNETIDAHKAAQNKAR
jgi:hypothetical protein